MTIMTDITIAAAGLVVIAVAIFVLRRRPRRLDTGRYQERWEKLQRNCADRRTWYVAVLDADKLLDEALKCRKYRGKTPGERLVAAQHELTTNDSVWFGHKLCNRINQENLKKLSKQDTLEALSGFRQALKDLGALPNDQSRIES